DGWLAALRTDVYGELVLYLPSDQDDGALEEASASVELGGGLLVIDQATDVAAGIEALGATRSGSISSLRSVTLTGTLGSGSLAATYTLELTPDPELAIVWSHPALTVGVPPAWRFDLAAGASTALDATLRLPSDVGSFAAAARLSASSGPLAQATLAFDVLRS